MIYFIKIFRITKIVLLFLPALLAGQLYDSQRIPENGNHFFGLGYFPASWQSNIFFEDAFASREIEQKVDFNILSNALRLNYVGAEKMLVQFKKEFPNSIEATSIDFDVANYYFNNEKYRYALKWFSRVSENQVPKASIDEYNFNKGYTLFSAKKYKQAKQYLEKVKQNKVYESDAHYYLGHIAYQLEDFDEARSQFSNISNKAQKENLYYFQADMNFRLGRFEKAITLGRSIFENNTSGDVSEISKIIGESYFNLNSFVQAIPYLEAYRGKKGTWENTDFYQLGFAYYKNGDYDKAIGQFNKIISKKNSLAQNANYYLADCYLKTNQKAAAQNAFKSASQMDFDLIIKEDAFLNYAKLTYEIGNPYKEPPMVLVDFLEQFPKNEQANLIEELLINSYTKNGNYQAALEILEETNRYKKNAILQRVLALKAIEDFKRGRYAISSSYFEKALKINKNKSLEAYILYWLGRSYYERNQFDDALEAFKMFKKHPKKEHISTFNRLSYDIGYIYFKLGEYDYALKSFDAFNKANNSFDISYQLDTFLRMGDCQFALKKYWPAIEHYNTSITLSSKRAAYALFQKAISYGFVDRNPKKIETLLVLVTKYKKDPLVDDALFELASSYSRERKTVKAIAAYEDLINGYQNSPYVPRALLNKGLILYNNENYNEAKFVLENVAIKYRLDPVAQQAVRTLREISVDQAKVSAFTKWIKSEGLNTFSDIELEKSTFTAAEKQFLEGNKNSAKKLLKEYLEIYSRGVYGNPAAYYLAEIYFEKEEFEEALPFYESLVEQEVSSYTEKALVRIVTLLKKEALLKEALPYLENLYEIASFEGNKRFATLNLMQGYFAVNKFEKSLLLSEEVLKFSRLEEGLKWDALKFKARSALKLNDTLSASSAYEILENSFQKDIAAEALYFKAERLYSFKKYKASNLIIERISVSSGQLGDWNAKALLLLAKNYYALDDPFQASFVLESVIENFIAFPSVIEEAESLLVTYKAATAKENRSINQDLNE